MNHPSEERLPDTERTPPPDTPGARILPFERPQSELQRAVQLRAQEALDRDRDRDRERRKPRPLKWLIILLIAMIPVILIFGAVDSFVRVMQRLNEAYKPPAATAPAAQPQEPQVSQPGVVLLQPYEVPPESGDAPDAESRPPESAPAPRN